MPSPETNTPRSACSNASSSSNNNQNTIISLSDNQSTDIIPQIEDHTKVIHHVHQAKLEKKAMDGDINLLKNRVQHLKAELLKANRKITETTHKATDIVEVKKRNQQRKKIREEKYEVQYGQSNEKVKALKLKQEEEKLKAQHKKLMLKKQTEREAEEYRRMKEERKRKQEIQARKAHEEVQRKVQKRKEAENLKRLAQQEKEKEIEKRRIEKLKQKVINMRELNKKNFKEIEKLEQREMLWINKLKVIQIEQKNAYKSLEEALAADEETLLLQDD